MTVYENINALVGYALTTGLIEEDDIIYTKNRLLELFNLNGFEDQAQAENVPSVKIEELETILSGLLSYGAENGLFVDSGIVSRDLFDTKSWAAWFRLRPSFRKNSWSFIKNHRGTRPHGIINSVRTPTTYAVTESAGT